MNVLIKKYNKSGPRYTSYPPVPFWNGQMNEETWIKHLNKDINNEGLDLYIHIPYCEKLCYYCGCHRVISKNTERGEQYANLLIKEWKIYLSKMEKRPVINTIHFGGGTPTFLSPVSMAKLLESLSPYFSKDFQGSIEVDPRTCKIEHLEVFKHFKFNRVSMGIQDFDPKVQKIINREQSFELVEKLVTNLRKHGVESINFDLIYGLPAQTKESIEDTISKVLKLSPDMIAFYSYAHLPEKLKNQRLIPEELLSDGEQKRELYERGKALLESSSMIEIGLDHFAKNDNYLAKVQRDRKLLRNFMGYTDKKSQTLLGLGVSSISNSNFSFAQNIKEIKDYAELINNGKLPIVAGHIHSDSDKALEEIIQNIMCNSHAHIPHPENLPFWNEIEREIEHMQEDGILIWDKEKSELLVTGLGRPFLRNICMSFDEHLRQTKMNQRFSKTI